MRRGFAYSLAALALALAVAQAAIIFSSAQSGVAYERSSQKDAVEFAAFSEGTAGLQSGLLLSCGLAFEAAKDYEESTNSTFVNRSCVLTFLARDGSVTNATCPGEPFALIETSNQAYSLSGWQQAAASERTGSVGISSEVLSAYATGNATRAMCDATALVTAATPGNSTFISRTYAAQRTVQN
ncbi:MAG: hypothetical protein WCX64_01530 [Candidatus Micrarchaeia archaeon]